MRKGEITRQKILEQAAPIFNQRGYEGCSMQDVMTATGLEKGGLYRHFSSKEELAVEAMRYAMACAVSAKMRTDLIDDAHGTIAQIKSRIRLFVESRSRMPGGCPLMNTAVDADDGNPALLRLAQEELGMWKSRLGAIVRDGIRSGEILPETEPRRVCNVVIGTLEGALMISRLEENRTALKDAQVALDAFIDGIAVKQARVLQPSDKSFHNSR